MNELQFNFEFIFSSGSFDQNVYNQCTLPDETGTRLQDIKNTISEVQAIFINVPGLNVFSTFLQEPNYRFKITVNNHKV